MVLCEACCFQVTGEEAWKKHKKTKTHKWRTAELEKCQRTIFLGKVPHWFTEQNLRDYFGQFAPIANLFLGPKFGMIEYHMVEPVETVLRHKTHSILGQMLPVERKKFNPKPIPGHNPDSASRDEDRRQILQELSDVSGVESQILKLDADLRLSEDDRNVRVQFRGYMEGVLQRFIPEVQLVAYGSSVSGLGTQGCDIDIMVQLNPRVSRFNLTRAPALPYLAKLKSLQMSEGRVTFESLNSAPLPEVVRFFLLLLQNSELRSLLDSFQPIPRARVPLIRMYHKTGGFEIDLTFGPNSVAVHNTRLIQVLLASDTRIRPLMLTLKAWAKQTGVSDGSMVSLTSYAFFLWVYTYLQNTTPPVLPSVDQLAAICGPEDRYRFNNLDCSFCASVPDIQQKLLQRRNTQSLDNLIQGFFEFYSKINILNTVICPRNGRVVDVFKFKSVMNATPHLETYKLRDLNIQDPFEPAHNTAGNANIASARNISREVLRAAEGIQDDIPWDLLTIIPLDKRIPETTSALDIVIPYQASGLPARFSMCTNMEHAHTVWGDWVLDLIKKVLGILRVEFSSVTCNTKSGLDTSKSSKDTVECTSEDHSKPAAVEARNKRSSEGTGSDEAEPKRIKLGCGKETVPNEGHIRVPTSSGSQKALVTSIFDTPEAPPDPECPEELDEQLSAQYKLVDVLQKEDLIRCSLRHEVWNCRKSARKEVDRGPLKDGDILSKEEEVTRVLLSQSQGVVSEEQICFTIRAQRWTHGHEAVMKLVVNGRGSTEFAPFISFFRAYLQKMLRTLLNSQE